MKFRQFILILFIALAGCDIPINDKDTGLPISHYEPKDYSATDTNVTHDIQATSVQVSPSSEIPDELKAPNHSDDDEEREGKWIIFFDANWRPTNYSNASYYRKVQFKNDQPVGKVQDFYINGNLQWEGRLASDSPKDILDGNCSWYSSDGTLNKKNCYTKGVLNGKETEYFTDGSIKTTRNYSNGILSGKYVDYIAINKILESGSYREGQKVGQWKYYDMDGDYKLTEFMEVRVGAICNDGSRSSSTGRGTCSHHGGVNTWLVETEEITIGGTGKYSPY